jgi:hypothetical protein
MLMQNLAAGEGRYLEVNFVALGDTTRANTYASLREPDGTLVTDEISRKVLDKVVLARFVFRDTSATKQMIYRLTKKGKIWAKAKRSLTRSAAILGR